MSDLNQLDRVLTKILEESWEVLWKDAFLYVLAALVYVALVACSLGIFSGIATVGFCILIQRRRLGQEVGVLTILSGFGFALSSTLAMLIMFVGITIGTLLLVLPGLFLMAAWSFTFYAMAAEDLGPGAALGRSYGIFREHALLVIVLLIVLAIVNTVGGAVFVGQLLTIPYSMIAMAIAFEKLAGAELPQGQATAPQPFAVPPR
jgi:hypothetical protein